ncbi:Pup amidohydrolase [Candidatus Hakubella thermalkaliphila]|uniref:Pup amidohydrolase n=1 Tax=Candidatus Hakubella thermalkaliphila TaxID=2754717 RepID=A0A6V8PKW4_9ACTN|nr:Pup amidohydrolase [Candidatus Hakubella thermalkaliphila]
MAIVKVMGIETEYGITIRDGIGFDPIIGCSLLINSYQVLETGKVKWDYEEEDPTRDARESVPPRKLREQPGETTQFINRILTNGARYYVDHAHPEYSSPECTNPRDLVIYDKAGERILDLSRQKAEIIRGRGERIIVYKNNTDSKGNSYGCHENYLLDRKTPFPSIIRDLMPFLVTRQIYTGAGKVGAENGAEPVSYQISQRSDFVEKEVGLETMLQRPIINTRDEPHADAEKYRRLHVIVGDSNMSEYTTYLKVGTTALVLEMIEDKFIHQDFSLRSPVQAIREISHDTSLKRKLRLEDGRQATAIEIQRQYLELALGYLDRRDPDPLVKDVLAKWAYVLEKLEEEPRQLKQEIDWVIKRELIEAYMARHHLFWEDPRISLIDLQYHDVRPSKGLYYLLEEEEKVERIVSDDEIEEAMVNPPCDTRAYFRGRCLQKYAHNISAASWDSMIFDLDHGPLKKVMMMEPTKGTEMDVGRIIDSSPTAADLLEALQS